MFFHTIIKKSYLIMCVVLISSLQASDCAVRYQPQESRKDIEGCIQFCNKAFANISERLRERVTMATYIDSKSVVRFEARMILFSNRYRFDFPWFLVGAIESILILAGQENVNLQTVDGYTLLHYACEHGEVQLIQDLLAKGACTDICDKWDKKPCDLAIKRQDPILKGFLESKKYRRYQTQ